MRNHATCAFIVVLATPARGDDKHPISKDKTGIRWTMPFKSALERARAESRLLMIKPVAFGTTQDGGW